MTEQYYNDTRKPVSQAPWRSNLAQQVAPDRQSSVIQRLVAEIDRDVALLDQSVAAEEMATRVYDKTDVKYSLSARHMRDRRDNLARTKVALLARLTRL